MDIGILIVDDDMLVVEKLEKTVNWEELGIKMVFTAKNIRQAQKCLEEYPIHILLSDIEMPQGSGLELLEWVRDKKIPVECIFLSSYAYFAYAQKALQLDSREYLLKPVSNRELENVLKDLVDSIREKEDRECGQIREAYTEFWESWLLQSLENDSFMKEAQKRGLYTRDDIIRMEIIRIFPDADHKRKKDNILFQFIINNVTTEFFGENDQQLNAVIRLSDFEWMLIFGSRDKMEELPEMTVKLKECMQKKMNLKVCMYIGCESPLSEAGAHRKNLEQMRQEAVPDETGILLEDEWMSKVPADRKIPWDVWEKQMNETQNLAAAEDKILAFLEELWEETRVTVSDMERFRRELMQLVYQYLNRQNVLISKIFDTGEFDIYFDNAGASVNGMKQFIHYLFDRLDGNRKMDSRQESVVDRLKVYIEAHLKEDLSRKVLAQTVYLSEDYISRIFTAVTGMSVSGYITQRRMEKAKEYLQHSGLTVSRIAMEVGYTNFSYFSKNFRDYVGCTPNEFRKRYI